MRRALLTLALVGCGGGATGPEQADPPPDITGTYQAASFDGGSLERAVRYGPCEVAGSPGVDSLRVVAGSIEVRPDSVARVNFSWRRTCWVEGQPAVAVEGVEDREAGYIPPLELPAEVILVGHLTGGYTPVRMDIALLGSVDVALRHQGPEGMRTFVLGAVR